MNVKAVKIPRKQRLLLLDPKKPITWPRVIRALLTRWGGILPQGGELTPSGQVAFGGCGHYSVCRLRILLHRHPGARPVPESIRAAMRGECHLHDTVLMDESDDTGAGETDV